MCWAGENQLIVHVITYKLAVNRISLLIYVNRLYYCNICHVAINPDLYWQLSSQIPSADVALITAGPHIKAVTNYKQVRMIMMLMNVVMHTHIMCAYYRLAVNTCTLSHPKNIENIENCVLLVCFSLARCPRHWKSLTLRSDHPVF